MRVRVAIVRGEDAYRTTSEALDLIADGFLKKLTRTILLKPNVLTVDDHGSAVTSPDVCVATADFLTSHGVNEIILAEGTTNAKVKPIDTFKAFKNHGYKDYEAKWKMIDLNYDEPGTWFKIYSPGLDYEVELGIAETVVRNRTISVAKLKTHDVLGITLCLKNMMGSICAARNAETGEVITTGPKSKAYMHGYGLKSPGKLTVEQNTGPSKIALAVNLVRLAKQIKPDLSVIDGIDAMEGDGPLLGTRKELGLVLASADSLAADIVGSVIAGINPKHTGYLHVSGLRGFGEHRLEKIEIVGEKIDEVKSPFKVHHLFPKAKLDDDEIEQVMKLANNHL